MIPKPLVLIFASLACFSSRWFVCSGVCQCVCCLRGHGIPKKHSHCPISYVCGSQPRHVLPHNLLPQFYPITYCYIAYVCGPQPHHVLHHNLLPPVIGARCAGTVSHP